MGMPRWKPTCKMKVDSFQVLDKRDTEGVNSQKLWCDIKFQALGYGYQALIHSRCV